jgi:hypothetical protein
MFKHISDCWQYIREATSYDDLLDRLDNLPRWSGDWTVEKSEDGYCLVINDYYDKCTAEYDSDEEELEIEYPLDKEEEK